jgi:hypothetical protein
MPLVQDSTIADSHLWVGQNHFYIEIKSSVLHALPVHTSIGGVSFKKSVTAGHNFLASENFSV